MPFLHKIFCWKNGGAAGLGEDKHQLKVYNETFTFIKQQ